MTIFFMIIILGLNFYYLFKLNEAVNHNTQLISNLHYYVIELDQQLTLQIEDLEREVIQHSMPSVVSVDWPK